MNAKTMLNTEAYILEKSTLRSYPVVSNFADVSYFEENLALKRAGKSIK